jgi:hypothetical protein
MELMIVRQLMAASQMDLQGEWAMEGICED